MFVDHIKIYAKAGDGGNGSAHFARKKFLPKGGPDGGDGGKGGDIVLKVDSHTDNLKSFFFKAKVRADDGKAGGENQKSGKSGKRLMVPVPQGTLVYREVEPKEGENGTEAELEAAEESEGEGDETLEMVTRALRMSRETGVHLEVVADLANIGDEFVLCKGGKGGRGNQHFKSATNRVPDGAEPGVPGEEGEFYFELRRIADAGMVGFPNAGKSTLVGKLSAAQPKVAAYPFTTLKPMVGVVDFPGFKRATVADIPGLIEGAHANIGLGHDFLRHIMRCRLLLFVVDMAGSDARDPIEDIEALRKELSLYDESLAKQPWMIVANKMDLPGTSKMLERFRQRFPKVEVLPISALNGDGIERLKERLGELVGHRPE
jgi:GTP-binding protein